jgi:hypothetical protein
MRRIAAFGSNASEPHDAGARIGEAVDWVDKLDLPEIASVAVRQAEPHGRDSEAQAPACHYVAGFVVRN